jgi:hypothetical protein
MFQGSDITNSNNRERTATFQVFNNGVLVPTAQGHCFVNGGGIKGSCTINTIMTLTNTQVVDIRWFVSENTGSIPKYSFNIVKINTPF